MDNIKLFKLANGHDILCSVVSEEDDFKMIETPVVLIPNEQQGVAAIPWIVLGDAKHVKLFKSHIMAEIEPDLQLKNFFNEKFGSGISIVSSMPENIVDINKK